MTYREEKSTFGTIAVWVFVAIFWASVIAAFMTWGN